MNVASAPRRRAVMGAAAMLLACARGALGAYGDANIAVPPLANPDLEMGQDAIAARDWPRAVYHLEIAARAEPANADIQVLLGYACRGERKYESALMHFREALRLDPAHRGAREHMGETYLLTGSKAKAQEQLAALEKLCGQGCPEYQELARAIAQSR